MINYWWSSDKKWFCLLVDDGVNKATVSLNVEEASLLSMNALLDPPMTDHPDRGALADHARELNASQPAPDVENYIKTWSRVLYDATGDMTKVNRAIELADLNGLFDPAKAAAEISRRIEMIGGPADHDPRRTARELLEEALKHVDFDGADPNTFTIAELRRAL